MNKIICGGLVIALLMTGVMSVATAEEYSDDYREGFYEGAIYIDGEDLSSDYKSGFYEGIIYYGQSLVTGRYLYSVYAYIIDGNVTEEETIAQYNSEAIDFNENRIPNLNSILMDVFEEDDERLEKLFLGELPLIET